MILNPWDVQSKHIHTPDGIASALYCAECRWGGSEMYVLVKQDDSSSKNETVVGADMFNFNFTGTITGALRGQRVDVISIPHILVIYEKTDNTDREEVL